MFSFIIEIGVENIVISAFFTAFILSVSKLHHNSLAICSHLALSLQVIIKLISFQNFSILNFANHFQNQAVHHIIVIFFFIVYFFNASYVNTNIAIHNLFNLSIFFGPVKSLYNHSKPKFLHIFGALF